MLNEILLKKRLHEINWNFHDALSNHSLHKFHWYPGSFIPQIPSYLIELFSSRDEVILDPFCGSGTTLVEALRLGRKAVGIDFNFIAALVSKAKTTFIAPISLEKFRRDFINKLENEKFKLNFNPSQITLNSKTTVNVAELKKWFHVNTFQESILIWNMISEVKEPFKGILLMLFSGIQMKLSKPFKHWGYIADNVTPSKRRYVDAISLFINTFNEYTEEVNRFLDSPLISKYTIDELNNRVEVINASTLTYGLVEKESIDLIVTSPPYVSVTDYITSQRLSLYWFGEDISKNKFNEIGARWKRSRKASIDDYITEMDLSFTNIVPTLKPGRFFCLVIGESDKRKEHFPVINKLKDIMISKGFVIFSDDISRKPIKQRVRAQKEGNIIDEDVIVFQKL
jgi:DNA modification methylase